MPERAFTRVSAETAFEGRIITVEVATFRIGDGETFTRDIVRHPGAVSVVPLHDDGTVTMVRQFRAALGTDLLEIPAGISDVPGEDPQETAARELAEEVGLAAGRYDELARIHNSAGFTDEMGIVYLARDLQRVGSDPQGHEEAAMTVARIALAQVPAMIAAGTLTDAKSIIGLLRARELVAVGS